jgi:hypothetical protein
MTDFRIILLHSGLFNLIISASVRRYLNAMSEFRRASM